MTPYVFEPRKIIGGWACPCQDVNGSSAVLHYSAYGVNHAEARAGANVVENYACDRNGDRWQRIIDPSGHAVWHYLGRRTL